MPTSSAPEIARWSELGPPEVLVALPHGYSPLDHTVFPLGGRDPEPSGVITFTRTIDVWTPSHRTPVASRSVAELGPAVRPLASGHGLFVLDSSAELVALDARTLVTRWRLPLGRDDRLLSAEACVVTTDRVWIRVEKWPDGVPPTPRLVGIDHDGVVRATVASPDDFPIASPKRVYIGQDHALVALDSSGAVRWKDGSGGPYALAGDDVVVARDDAWRVLSGATGAELVRGAPPSGASFVDGASAGDVLHALVEWKAADGTARIALAAWDTSTGSTLWTTPERTTFGATGGALQATRAEAIYANDEDQEIAAIDDATHAEKWYWPIAPPDPLRTLRFVFANDGQAALYAESFADGEPSVVVFRPGAAPPVTLVHVEGHVLFEGRPVAGAAVRARSSSTRSNAAGAFTLDVPARGTFRILATARGVGPAPCRSASGAASGAPGDTSPVMIDLASACDQSDE